MAAHLPVTAADRTAVIVAACRTPFGLSDGTTGLFRHVRADDLAARAVAAAVARAGLDPREVAELVLGTTQQRGALGGNAARAVALLAGLPLACGGVTVDRGDASGLEALLQAGRAIATGASDVLVAAGVDHLHHLPVAGGVDHHPRLVGRSSRGVLAAGLVAEHLAASRGISRSRQEDLAAASHARALRSARAGALALGIVPVDGHDPRGGLVGASGDQGPRAELTLESMAALGPLFLPGSGTITAATGAPDADGAAAVVVMSEAAAARLATPPLARLVAGVAMAVPPAAAGTAAAVAVGRLLGQTGLGVDAIDRYEIDETFAAVTLATIDDVGLDHARVNTEGGAIAIGHAPGATGLRMVTSLALALGRREARRGVVAMGGSLGQGIALLLERCG